MVKNKETSAAYFRGYLTLLSDYLKLPVIGLTIVRQEGLEFAGDPDTIYLVSNKKSTKIAEEIKRSIEEHLRLDNRLILPNSVEYIELTGAFRKRVGYVWIVGKISPLETHLRAFAEDVTSTMENSKKSEFHAKFFDGMHAVHNDLVEKNIAETISKGLYCNKVIAWEVRGKRLVSLNYKGYGLITENSLASEVVKNCSPVIVDNIKNDSRLILYREALLEEGLNSFFLFPVLNERKKDVSGVIGVFYKRPLGTTEIDKFLCEYVIRYYELVWKLQRRIVWLETIENESSEARNFHVNSVKTLVDLHELKANLMSVFQEFSEALVYGHNNPKLQTSLKQAMKYLQRTRDRIERHDDSFVMANEYIQVIYARENDILEKCNLREAIKSEIEAHISEAKSLDYNPKVKIDLPQRIYRVNKEDVLSICNNFFRNSIQSLGQKPKTRAQKRINFEVVDLGTEILVRCYDNGVGIDEDKLEEIFNPHYTTNKDVGGQGLGLAIVRAICLKNKNQPEVDSTWGEYATFSARIRVY